MSEAPLADVVIRKSALKVIVTTLAVAAAAIAIAWALAPGGTEGLVRTLVILFFGVGGLFYAVANLNQVELRASAEGLRLVKRWDSDVVIPWSDKMVVNVFEMRGTQYLVVSVGKTQKGLFIGGFELTPYEMQSRINAYRLATGHAVPQTAREAIVPDTESGMRNRRRRLGMGLVGVSAVAALFGVGGVSQVGVQDLPPGVDFLWAQAPTVADLTFAALSLALSLWGCWLWFGPHRTRANPPILSSLSERLVAICLLAQVRTIWLWLSWLQHPV